ncbi:MAG TPA: NADPH-dependent FMN reductase [Candidatus Binataceae bacterium]|nr:NADPH-dependent FMN reductase [Candidatus Binataceae bacterium]
MKSLLAIVGAVTPPGRLLNATTAMLTGAREAHPDLSTHLINLADRKIAFADGRSPEAYGDDTAATVKMVGDTDAVIIASPIYRGSITGALKNLLDHVPVEGLMGKPVAIIAMGATTHHYLGVDWHLRDILAWFGAMVAPTSVYLSSADFVDGKISEGARGEMLSLVETVIKLGAISGPLGPKPLAARR